MNPPPPPKVDPDPVKAAQQAPPAQANLDGAVFAVLGPSGAFSDWVGVGLFNVSDKGVSVIFLPCGGTRADPNTPALMHTDPNMFAVNGPPDGSAALFPLSSPEAVAIGKAIAASQAGCAPNCDWAHPAKQIFAKVSGTLVTVQPTYRNADGGNFSRDQHYVGGLEPFLIPNYGCPQFYAHLTKVEIQ
jgi:hypothetical protein